MTARHTSTKERTRRANILREYFQNAILLAALKETVRTASVPVSPRGRPHS